MKTIVDNFIFGNFTSIKKELVIKMIAIFAAVNVLVILPDIFYIFGEQRILQEAVNERYIFWYQPTLALFTDIFAYIGFTENMTFLFFLFLYGTSLVSLWQNYNRPLFGVLAWFIHFMFVNSTYLFSYGADYFISFMLFINMLICLGYVFNKATRKPLYSYVLRFLQVHLCLVYFFAGIGKALGTDWFDGNAIWMVINTYTSSSIVESSVGLASYPIVFKVLAWGTVALELFYPILMYSKKTRKVALVFVIMMHAGIGILMQFYTFALVMILLNLIAFGQHFNWKRTLSKKEEAMNLPLATGTA